MKRFGKQLTEGRNVMNTFEATIKWLPTSVLAGATLLTLIGAGSAGAEVNLRVPDDTPGIPAYARVERPTIHTDEWAAIVFYRDPECVPADFNLLDFIDFPRAFDCRLTVSGFEVWDNGPDIDGGPRHAYSSGHGVPVWFVDWSIFQGAIADDFLTMTELESLAPLKGSATTFHEVIHPIVPPGMTGGAKVPHLTITASGVLPDGRSFQLLYDDVLKKNTLETIVENVRIVFR